MQTRTAHYQFLVISLSYKFIAFASTAGGLRNCNAAAFASFYPDCFGIKFLLRRNRTKRGDLCNYWWKCGQGVRDPNGWLSDLVNGCLVNGQWSMVKIRTFYSFWCKMQIRPVPFQFSVIQLTFTIDHSPFTPFIQHTISFQLSIFSYIRVLGLQSPPLLDLLSRWWGLLFRLCWSSFYRLP